MVLLWFKWSKVYIEATKPWFDKRAGLLKTIGFKFNPYDPCVLNQLDSNGGQTTLAIHVDDVLITAPSEEAIDQLLVKLGSVEVKNLITWE
jgi:hypothetical protein